MVTAEVLRDVSDSSQCAEVPNTGEVSKTCHRRHSTCMIRSLKPYKVGEPQTSYFLPGFPVGGCRLEQHCPPISQPLLQLEFPFGSKVTALVRESPEDRGREDLA